MDHTYIALPSVFVFVSKTVTPALRACLDDIFILIARLALFIIRRIRLAILIVFIAHYPRHIPLHKRSLANFAVNTNFL